MVRCLLLSLRSDMQTLNGSASVGLPGDNVANAPVAMPRVTDIVCSAALAGVIGLSVALMTGLDSRPIAVLVHDLSGLLFLIAAASYRGSVKMWWLLMAPASFLLLMAPVAVAEAKGTVTALGDLLRTALVPGLAFLAGNLVATFRDTLTRSRELTAEIGGLEAKLIAHALDLKKLGGEMAEIMDRFAKNEFTGRFGRMKWNPVEYALAPYDLEMDDEMNRIDYNTLEDLIGGELDRFSGELIDPVKVKISFAYPRELTIPIEVRGSARVLRSVLRGLLNLAQDSLVGGEGVIRVDIRLGINSVSLSVEDNGRGLNEAFILRLQEKGVLPRSTGRWDLKSLRQTAEASGWRFEMHARLGVGARVTIELPRVDAFAYGAKARRNRLSESFAEVQARSS